MKKLIMQRWSKNTVLALIIALLLIQGCKAPAVETPTPTPSAFSIIITPDAPSIAPNTTEQLTATGRAADNSTVILTDSVTWESSDPSVATVNSQGLAEALQQGTTTITALSGSISGTTILTVSPVSSLAVAPSSQTIASGTTCQFGATAALADGATQDLSGYVAWSSSDTGVATVAAGLATASTATGTTTISALWESVTGTAQLTVSSVSSIGITPANASIILGTNQQFTATGVLTAGGAGQDLTSWATWISSSDAVATVSNAAGSKGLATSVAEGTASISASFGGVASNSAVLTVSPSVLESIAIMPDPASAAVGLTQQFTATGTYNGGSTTLDITASVTWTSSDTSIATISNAAGSAGLATALAEGTTNITASLDGITSNAAVLSVTPAELLFITLSPSNPTLSQGTTQQFTALGTYSDGFSSDVTESATWTSSDTSIATVSDLVLSKGYVSCSLLNIGTTTITASVGSIFGNTVVTVILP